MIKRFTIQLSKTIILLLVFCSTLFSASSGTLKGKIQNSLTKEPLLYSNVILLGTSFGTAADKEGNFILRNIPPGTYTLRVTYIGYKQEEISVQILGGKTTELNILLNPEVLEGETVVVTAQSEGQNQAINEQLSSVSIKNVVSMAKIQELPDANASESVSRLPGVSLIRTGGEGSRVVVRGLSPQYNQITIDGVELPANFTSNDPNDHKSELSGSDQLSNSGDRSTDLSMISSNMLGGIEVIKAITPDMDATVFGGVVNFSMRKAIKNEFTKPRFEILSQGSHNSLKGTFKDYKVVGSYEQRFFDNSFGLFVLGSIEDKNLSANQLNANYFYAAKIIVEEAGDPVYQSTSLTDALRDRNRYGATVVLDYDYETGSIGLMNFFSRSDTRTISRNESYFLERNELFNNATNSNSNLDVFSNLLSFKQQLGDLKIAARLSHSYSVNNYPEDVNFSFWQQDAGFKNLSNALKFKSSKEIASYVIHDPENSVLSEIYNNNSISKDRVLNGGIDLSTDVTISNDFTSNIKIGGAYQYRYRSYDYNQSSGSMIWDDGPQVMAAILRAYPQFGNSLSYADFIDPNYNYGEFLNGDYTLGSPMDVDLMLKVIEIAKRNPGVGNGGGYKLNKLSSKADDYSGNEARSAVYAMTTLNIGQMFKILPGVRYQNLTTTYTGVRGEAVPVIGIQFTDAKETQSHGYWLPMFHFRFKPLDWFQFHFAYTNTLNYPDYNTIIPKYYIGKNYIVYNNYRLKPATSENFDAVCSFYSNEIGLFAVSGFKKNIKDLIFPDKAYDISAYPEVYDIVKNRPEKYSLFTYINSPFKINIYGMEAEWQTNFWYLPEPFSGTVLNINYTHIFSKTEYPRTVFVSTLDTITWIPDIDTLKMFYSDRLLNQPNDIINVALGYDYGGFSIRISMLYQDNIFKNPDFHLQNRVHSKKHVRFDLSAKQKLPWFGIQVYFNLNNISGEDDIDINEKTSFYTSQERYGMTADLGMRIDF